MKDLIEAARQAKEYLRQKEPMTGEVTAIVAALQLGIEEAERDRLRYANFLHNLQDTSCLMNQILNLEKLT